MWRFGVAYIWLLQQCRLLNRDRASLFPEVTLCLIKESSSLELFSLAGLEGGAGAFDGATILGSVVIDDARIRTKLIRRILMANRYNIGGMKCLGAEYGVRLESNGTTVDLTFCFDCSNVWVTAPSNLATLGTTSMFPVPLMRRLLKKADIPLPPPQNS